MKLPQTRGLVGPGTPELGNDFSRRRHGGEPRDLLSRQNEMDRHRRNRETQRTAQTRIQPGERVGAHVPAQQGQPPPPARAAPTVATSSGRRRARFIGAEGVAAMAPAVSAREAAVRSGRYPV